MAGGRSGRGLSFGQAIDFVVHDHHGNVDIAQRGMHQMACANAEEVTITSHRYNGKIGTRHLQPLSHRKRAAMHAVKAKGADEMREAAGAADARYHGRFSAASAVYVALSTPKSPQPGHQVGFTSLLKSFGVSVIVD